MFSKADKVFGIVEGLNSSNEKLVPGLVEEKLEVEMTHSAYYVQTQWNCLKGTKFNYLPTVFRST